MNPYTVQPPHPQRRSDEQDVTRRNVFVRLLTLFAAAPFAGLLTRRAHASAPSPQPGSLYKLVTYQVPSEHWQEFLAIAAINAQASRQEPGITSFTLLLPQETPNTAIAVEVYTDANASAAHQSTPHFHAFVEGAQKLGVQRSLIIADRYDPH
jgi:autoinducer 2-degrading protein